MLPAVTDDEYASEDVEGLQSERYLRWTTEGVSGVIVKDCDAPRAKVSPRVSVGAEGGLWLADLTAYTSASRCDVRREGEAEDTASQFEDTCPVAGGGRSFRHR